MPVKDYEQYKQKRLRESSEYRELYLIETINTFLENTVTIKHTNEDMERLYLASAVLEVTRARGQLNDNS